MPSEILELQELAARLEEREREQAERVETEVKRQAQELDVRFEAFLVSPSQPGHPQSAGLS